MSLETLLRAAAVVGLLAGAAPARAAFSCPAQDAGASGDSINLASMPLSAESPNLPQPVLDAVGRMQANNVGNGRIVDRLVGAYCGRVASEAGLSDAARADAVERFASRLARFIYTSPTSTEEDILVDVPVPHSTFNAMAAAAKKENVSQDAWVNAAIRSKLGNP